MSNTVKHVNTDIERGKKVHVLTPGCPIKRVEHIEKERAFFPQGQSKLCVITRFPF